MRIKFERLSTTRDGGLRTNEVIGDMTRLPSPGERFYMTAPPLEGGTIRAISTSLVLTIDQKDANTYEIHTENSVYRITVL
jgi:hypothetical protein